MVRPQDLWQIDPREFANFLFIVAHGTHLDQRQAVDLMAEHVKRRDELMQESSKRSE